VPDAVTGTAAGPAHRRGPRALHPYWQATAFAATLLDEFRSGLAGGQPATARGRFYVLARYLRRTLAIVHDAVERRDEDLVDAGLRNVLVLQRALAAMHREAPDLAPTTLALETDLHERLSRDLVHQVLRDAPRPLDATAVLDRFNELDLVGDLRPPIVAEALASLVASGHAVERRGRYVPTQRPYIDTNADRAGLAMLVGAPLAGVLAEAGFDGLFVTLERQAEFAERLREARGFGPATAGLVVACAEALARPVRTLQGRGRWQGAGLRESAWPRPYQRLLHAILRGHRYAAQVIEAPNGSGKTMVGMLCIEDWLDELAPGQSILVLVPTVNYQQQWTAELCLNPVGLRLQPQLVQAGAPAPLERSRAVGAMPVVLLVTYAALARLAAGAGRGGFDETAIERFLQAHGVRHVILDEVHKVVADPASPTAAAMRVLVAWLRDGSLRSLIGLSATLVGLEAQLSELGLELACALRPEELIAQGWVAPFTELGVPFSWSARERQILDRVEAYRADLQAYLQRLGGPWLRARFAAIPIEERVQAGGHLGMYPHQRDRTDRIRRRLLGWESGGELGLDELPLVAILQTVRRCSDAELLRAAGHGDEAEGWLRRFDELRIGLRALLPPGPARRRLDAADYGTAAPAFLSARASGFPPALGGMRTGASRDRLASTFTGLYLGIRDWSRQAGEGRVAAIRAIIAAERRSRAVPGVIVFDDPDPLRWAAGPATPGYRGAGGLYAELLDDPGGVPLAALSGAIYLPDDPNLRLPERIADWILEAMVCREQREALLGMLLSSAGLEGAAVAGPIGSVVESGFRRYSQHLASGGRSPARAFRAEILRPLRAAVRRMPTGPGRRRALGLLALDRHHPQLRSVLKATLDYGRIARSFRAAEPRVVVRGDGSVRTVRVVPMPSGERRQRAYDLTARIVDAPELPVDTIVVSSWARTGWNVKTPNVLIDATATRDVIAWRQLRGRAMRPVPGWPIDAQRLLDRLEGRPAGVPVDRAGLERSGAVPARARPSLSKLQRRLVRAALPPANNPLRPWFEDLAAGQAMPEDVPDDLREAAAAHLLAAHNKVAHVYELLQGHGARRQVRLDRRRGGWERTEPIAEKHRREWSVRASDGAWLSGPQHAPLVIVDDPRRDSPADLEARLVEELRGGDELVVRGWLRAAGRA
jgi:hypothetical protein